MEAETLHHAFSSFLREGLFWAASFYAVSAYASSTGRRRARGGFLLGMVGGILAGMAIGRTVLPQGSPLRDLWVAGGLAVTAAVFGTSVMVSVFGPREESSAEAGPWFWLPFGFVFCFFDAGAAGAVVTDYLLTAPGAGLRVAGAAAGGALAGIVPFLIIHRWWKTVRWQGAFGLPTVVLVLGALGIVAGGIDDFAEQNLMVSLQLGLTEFVGRSVLALRKVLLLEPHQYVDVPWAGLFDFLGGDRVGMSLMVAAVFFPPTFLLVRIFAAPDPEVDHLDAGAARRQTLAFFRNDLMARATPVLTVFAVVLVQVHAANLALNPLFDPQPVPVLPDDSGATIRIPLEDRMGDFKDGKLRRYLYNYGDRKIVFIAIMKPDGGVSTCLDECEICEPAEWNRKAKGYAQRGKNLVCKYCVTPIPVHTVGKPGGCNPVPFPSTTDGRFLYVSVEELVRAWRELEAMDKTGTHF